MDGGCITRMYNRCIIIQILIPNLSRHRRIPRIRGLERTFQFNPDKTNRAPPPSKWTVGKNGRRMYWSIERSSAVGGRYPLGKNGRRMYWSIERSSAVGGRYPLGKNGRRMYTTTAVGGGTPYRTKFPPSLGGTPRGSNHRPRLVMSPIYRHR